MTVFSQLFINNLLLVDARQGIYEIEFAPMIWQIFFMSEVKFELFLMKTLRRRKMI